MNPHLLCSIRGRKRIENRDSILADAMTLLVADYGRALDGMEWRRLDMVTAGRAWCDLTDIKGLHVGQTIWAKRVIDLWWRVKDRQFQPGRGYEEWLWQSVYQYLRICGEGGRTLRVMVS